MKRFLGVMLAVVLFISTAACGGSSDNNTAPPDPTAGPPDLSGQWKQVNNESEDSYQGAIISGDKIEIYWVSNNGDTRSLYWAGSFDAPDTEDEPYYWNSRNNTAKTSGSMLASGDRSKRFTYEDEQISYSATIMGSTTKVRLEKMEWEPGLTIEDDPPIYEEIQPTEKIQDDFNADDYHPFSIGGLEFLIPNYYQKDEKSSLEEICFTSTYGDTVLLYFITKDGNGALTQAKFDQQIEEMGATLIDSFVVALDDSEVLDSKNILLAGLPGYISSVSGKMDGMSVTIQAAYTYNSTIDQLLAVMIIQFGNLQYDYFSDYEKILETAKLNTKAGTSVNPPASSDVSGIRPEFKTAMDNYEDFFDEYIEFMQKFSNSTNTTDMLSDYMDYLEKLTKTMDAMEALDDGSLSPEEEAYYLEVTTRVYQKLLTVAQ